MSLFLQAHLESCQYNMVSCSECAAMVSRTHLKDHLKYDCKHRHSTCEFCGREFQGPRMEVGILWAITFEKHTPHMEDKPHVFYSGSVIVKYIICLSNFS